MRALALVLAFVLSASVPAAADRVTLFAAASLKDALDEIAPAFEAETGHELTVSLAGSSALARQIEQGAPADVFISANPAWMDVLESQGLTEPETRRPLLGNSLVLIAHAPAAPVEITQSLDLAALIGDGRLAMALVDAVPAGIYAKHALEALGLWGPIAPRVVQADNVRAALALVATGEASHGIVYATDARAEPAVHVLGTFPADSHPAIVYPAAAIAGAGKGAALFLDWLQGDTPRAAFERQGFKVLGE